MRAKCWLLLRVESIMNIVCESTELRCHSSVLDGGRKTNHPQPTSFKLKVSLNGRHVDTRIANASSPLMTGGFSFIRFLSLLPLSILNIVLCLPVLFSFFSAYFVCMCVCVLWTQSFQVQCSTSVWMKYFVLLPCSWSCRSKSCRAYSLISFTCFC